MDQLPSLFPSPFSQQRPLLVCTLPNCRSSPRMGLKSRREVEVAFCLLSPASECSHLCSGDTKNLKPGWLTERWCLSNNRRGKLEKQAEGQASPYLSNAFLAQCLCTAHGDPSVSSNQRSFSLPCAVPVPPAPELPLSPPVQYSPSPRTPRPWFRAAAVLRLLGSLPTWYTVHSIAHPASPPASLLASHQNAKQNQTPTHHTSSRNILDASQKFGCPLFCCEYSSYPSASVSLSGTVRTVSLSRTVALLMVPAS